MLLCFPNLDTLRLALTSVIAPKLSETAVRAGFDEDGRLWVEPTATLSTALLAELRKLGVSGAKSSPAPLTEELSCWLQLFPMQRTSSALVFSERSPVLFDLPAEQLSGLVSEMLRLGNDRQGFRYLETSTGPGTAFLRVLGPPYYSLLRALDRDGEASAPVAYVECAPRVWVQIGYEHPLGSQLKPKEGQILLLRPPRQWTYLQDAPFRDIYEIIEFQLPQATVDWREGKLPHRLTIPLRLGQGSGTDVAELWVLHEQPFEQLDALVHSADDQLLARLDFAVGDRGDQQVFILRVRPSKHSPPELSLQAVAFRRFQRLPNLFVPCHTRLQPPLRQDTVRKLLADNPDTITWLFPQGDGTFLPESVPDSVFRPLSDWIDYVLDHDRKELTLWVESSLFDFEQFVCTEAEPGKPKPPPADRTRTPKRRPLDEPPRDRPARESTTQPSAKPRRRQEEAEDDFAEIAQVEPSVLQKQLRELEEKFRGLKEAERQELWPELARLNAALGHSDDAGICWMHALWPVERPSPQGPWSWFQAEAQAVEVRKGKGQPQPRSWAETPVTGKMAEISGDDLDRVLSLSEVKTADVRTLAAYLVWAGHRTTHSSTVMERLNRLRLFLEKHEDALPVRAVWLAWVSLARLAGGDVLVLARARDRLLERLFKNGLKPEQDLPNFLRSGGKSTNRRFGDMGQWVKKALYPLVRSWQTKMGDSTATGRMVPRTPQYLDLMFSFGLAKLGEKETSKQLLAQANKVLGDDGDEAHSFLLEAFAYRIEQALAGQPHTGPLPAFQMEYLAEVVRRCKEKKKKAKENELQVQSDYPIERMRCESRILEPDQKTDPYREIKAREEFAKDLAGLPDIIDRDELIAKIRSLLKKVPQDLNAQTRMFWAILDQAPRAGQEFALQILEHLQKLINILPEVRNETEFENQAGMLERGLFVAAHFDLTEQVQELVARLNQMLEWKGLGEKPALASLAGHCFRSLRKMGMRKEIDQMFDRMAERILGGATLKSLDPAKLAQQVPLLCALLHLAGGWFYFDRSKEAQSVLRLARQVIYRKVAPDQPYSNSKTREQTELASTYAATLAQAPADTAQPLLEEMFKRLEGVRDNMTSKYFFNRHQLQVIEAAVLAVASDDFLMGAETRRWLDEDEFLIRRRIHQDVRAMMTV